jgi:hypothetical protein
MCCSGKRAMMRSSGAFRPNLGRPRPDMPVGPASPAFIVFQHVGAGPLTVQGPVSGRQYRFSGPGATAPVDPRDRASLGVLPQVREVRR